MLATIRQGLSDIKGSRGVLRRVAISRRPGTTTKRIGQTRLNSVSTLCTRLLVLCRAPRLCLCPPGAWDGAGGRRVGPGPALPCARGRSHHRRLAPPSPVAARPHKPGGSRCRPAAWGLPRDPICTPYGACQCVVHDKVFPLGTPYGHMGQPRNAKHSNGLASRRRIVNHMGLCRHRARVIRVPHGPARPLRPWRESVSLSTSMSAVLAGVRVPRADAL
jgi:hypothetical protein